MPVPDSATSLTISGATTLTSSHTCTGTELALYVFVAQWATDATHGLCTGITYNAVALELIADSGFSSANDRVMLFRLLNPATGAHNLVTTFSGGSMTGRVMAQSVTAMNQVTPEGVPALAVGSDTSPTVSLSCESSDMCIDGVASDDTGTPTFTMVTDVGRTLINNTSGGGERGAYSRDEAPTATETMDWTISASRTWAIVAIALRDLSAPDLPEREGYHPSIHEADNAELAGGRK